MLTPSDKRKLEHVARAALDLPWPDEDQLLESPEASNEELARVLAFAIVASPENVLRALDHVERQRALIQKITLAFRLNIMRSESGIYTHAAFDDLIKKLWDEVGLTYG